MASNPYVNKVQYSDGTTIIDISTDTAVAADVATGKYFHLATGERVAGTNPGGSGDGYVWQDVNGYVHLSDEEGTQPIFDTLNVSASGTFTPAQGHAYNSVVVPSGTAGTPTATKGTVSNHSISVTPSVTNTAGYISGGTKTGTSVSVSASELVSGTYSVTSSGTKNVANYESASVPAGTVTAPSSISGTSATVSTGTNTLTLSKTVSVTPSVTTAGYVSSGTSGNSSVSLTASVNTRSSSDLSASGATVTAPAGYYASSASKSVASGTEGTPTATKGTVSNHSVSITPSVTNTAGYISGGTKTGTAVTVSVSELESGTKSITENGTGISVSGYSSVDVAVTGSGNTCTITSTGSSNTVFVTYNNTRYYTINDTFTFNGGDTLLLTCTRGNDNYIILNGEYIESVVDGGISSYSFTLPDCDIEISFRVSNGYSSITISAPYTTITSNGMHDVSGYGYASVAVPSQTPTLQTRSVTYTPTTSQQTATVTPESGYDGLSAVNVTINGFDGYSKDLIKNYIARNSTFTSMDITGMTIIGNYAFAGCTYLTTITGANAVTSIGSYSFYNCSRFNPESLPSGLTGIGAYAFWGCSSLTLTSLPSGVTTINQYAFYGCTNLALTSLPSGLTSIGPYAFYDCTNLQLTSLPNGLTKIDNYTFRNCHSLAFTTLPSTVTYIGSYAFAGNNFTSISCDGVITTLSSNAFTGSSTYSSQLVSARFPNLATTSGLSYVFGSSTAASACQVLEEVDLGNASQISSNMFYNCYSLETLVLRRTSAICSNGATNTFTNTPFAGYGGKTGTVYVPSALISTYRTATNWKTLYDAGTLTFTAIEGSQYEL